MSPEKEAQLIGIYSAIFQNDSAMSCINLFGFECGDGWFNVLKELIEQIRDICVENCINDETDDNFPIVTQVKEKYGSLRFYMNSVNDEISSVIEVAEDKSRETCELCGKAGHMVCNNRWYMVRCDECFKPDNVLNLIAQQPDFN
jgi:hypothetical protein